MYKTLTDIGLTEASLIGSTIVENLEIENALNFESGFQMLKNLIIRDLSIAGNVFILPVYNASNSVI
jgi:hypothetical protein